MQTNIIRLPELIKRVSLSRSSIYNMITRGQFPRQIELGARAVGWIEEDIENWVAGRINRRCSQNKGC